VVIEQLSAFCAQDIRAAKLTDDDKLSGTVQRSLLSNSPDIVVSTPARAWHNIQWATLEAKRLTHLILDEADLLLSYGYREDLENVAQFLPTGGVQTILMSATLTAEVDALKGIFCRNPAFLDVDEEEPDRGVTQFVVRYVVRAVFYRFSVG
jgi:ATP-dependent RNA helicase DDX56/DBP9